MNNRASLDHTVTPGPEWSRLTPLPKCRGDTCKQGRASCRTPQACGLIYSGRKHEGMARRFVIRGVLLCILAAAYWWTK